LWVKFVALARTDEIVYRYWIYVYAFIGCGRPNRERKISKTRPMGTNGVEWDNTALERCAGPS
jgi:hypothetical protein